MDYSTYTYMGRKVYPITLTSNDISVIDIGHALSKICKFGGRCNVFYSVAQHSTIVAKIVPVELRMLALFHDAYEAYISDIGIIDIGAALNMNILRRNIKSAIMSKLFPNIKFPLPDAIAKEIEQVDEIVSRSERRDFYYYNGEENSAVLPFKILPMTSDEARSEFFNMWDHHKMTVEEPSTNR